jgi:hypothetical protein
MSAATTLPAPPEMLDEETIEQRAAFEESRARRIVRLCDFAAKAMSMAAKYTDERATPDDARVCGALRQARDYLAQIDRLRAMRYQDADAIIAVTLADDIAAEDSR